MNFRSSQSDLRSTRKFLFRSIAKLLTIALSSSLLAIVVAEPARAVNSSCRASTFATNNPPAGDGYEIANDIRIQPVHGKYFYVDLRRNINAAYVGYRITNMSNVSRSNVWVKLSDFTGGALGLSNSSDSVFQISSLPGYTGSGGNKA